MTNDSEWENVMYVWHEIKDEDTRTDLAIMWLEKDKLEFIEIHEKHVVNEAVRLLKLIRDKPDKEKLKEHQKDFLRLLHHVKPTREWQEHIQEELNEIGAEVKDSKEKLRRKVAEIAQRKMEARRQRITQAPQSRIVVETTQAVKIGLETVRETYYNIGKYLDNGFWAIPTQNPQGNYLFAKEDMNAITDELVFRCYPNLPPEARGQTFQFTFSFCEIIRLAWTSAGLEDKRAAGILSAQLIPGEVLITDAFHTWKKHEEEKIREHREMVPPPRSMQQLIETSDKKTWVWMRVGDIIAIPFPPQNPKSYYLIPHPDHLYLLRVERLTKFYPNMRDEDKRDQYIIEKAAWASVDVLKRTQFDVDRIEATWTTEGEVGQVKKIR